MVGKIISHFEVLELLGKGGMGVVYKCRDLELDRLVAIKFLVDEVGDTEDAVDRFMREARAASSLDHPNICNVHEIGRTDDGNLFIVMALYGGDTLRNRMARGLGADEVIDFATQIARGLAAAHEEGIVHRDIKPGNIVLTERERAVIVDFGLATLPGFLTLTKTGSTLGTAAYMSPEQLTGSLADARSDVWSLGVVLYEMLNGKRPFAGDYEQAISYAIVNQDPEPAAVADDDPRLPRLEEIVTRCLSKDPADRYQDGGELAAELELLASTRVEQTNAKPENRSKRRRLVGGVAAVVAVLLFVSAVIFGWNPLPQLLRQGAPDREMVDDQSTTAAPVLLILPFENLGNAEDAYFATGVSDEITGRLSTIRNLSVISRRSAERYADTDMSTREIGDELGVDYILEGQVRWARQDGGQSQVRISPALIRVSDDTQLWAESYDRRIEDIFSIQADVATRVASELDSRLSESDRTVLEQAPTDNVAAYEEFLRGTALFDEEDLENAAKSFEQVLRLDPGFKRAAYLLSRTYSFHYFIQKLRRLDDPDELRARAAEATDRAVALAPGSAEARLAAGYYQYYVEGDHTRAADEFEAAITMRPGDADAHASLGYLLRRIGKYHESVDQLDRALDLDPNNLTFLREAARTHGHVRDYRVADSLFGRAIKLDPLNERFYCLAAENLFAWKGVTEELIQRWESRPPPADGLSACTPSKVDLARRDFQKILAELTELRKHVPDDRRVIVTALIGATNRYAGNKEGELAALREIEKFVEERATERQDRYSLIALSWVLAAQGDSEAVKKIDAEIMEMDKDDKLLQLVSTLRRAEVFTIAGFKQEAIELLRSDLESDVGIVTRHHLILPAWDSLRAEPEFQALEEL